MTTLTDDVIDTREIISRIEELESESEALAEKGDILPDEEREELESLRAFRDAHADSITDWEDGATLINDAYFQDYAEELADDIGAVYDANKWPLNCIDWERAASELKQDYTAYEHDGVAYWAV